MERISSLMTASVSETTVVDSCASFISSGDKSLPKSSLDESLPSLNVSSVSQEGPGRGSEEAGFSSLSSRRTSFMETATWVIARPMAVIFDVGVFFTAEQASQTVPTCWGIDCFGALFGDPVN